METTEILVDALAVFRVAHLITADHFPPVRRLRDTVQRRYPGGGQQLDAADGWWFWKDDDTVWKAARAGVVVDVTGGVVDETHAYTEEGHPFGFLIGCPWCFSWWAAGFVVAARRYAPRYWDPLARALAFSAVAGIVSAHV